MEASRGISPILATVILIAVTLVIAVGVIGWVMGIWRGMGQTEALKVIADSLTVSDGTGTLTLIVTNQGTIDATIEKVKLGTNDCTLPEDPVKIQAGQSQPVTATCQNVVSGVSYSGHVITASGNSYPFYVTAS